MAVIVPTVDGTSPKYDKKTEKSTFLLAQDLNYSRKLADNDEKTRRRALKYLKKYLEHRYKASGISEMSLQILWKGLFYSMWMSDKPLIQEECAENISKLIHSFEFKESMQFFQIGLITIQNEWIGIDQLRLDKFLMFVRRLLRQALVVLKGKNFKKRPNETFAKVLEDTILSSINYTPLGLFMHFTEIYLEELAKISDGVLQPTRTTELLKPFINRLAFASNSSIIKWINKFIFTHLMKQHKLGLEYEEKYKVWREQGFRGSIYQIQKVVVPDNESEKQYSDDDLRKSVLEDKPLDPRAGRVDVELPQILFNAKELSEAFVAIKSDPKTTKNTRMHLNIWSEKFLKLHNGMYPLGLKKLITKKRKKDVDMNVTKAAKRLIKFEQKLLAKNVKEKKRKREDIVEDKLFEPKKKKLDADLLINDLEMRKEIKPSENRNINKREQKTNAIKERDILAKKKKKMKPKKTKSKLLERVNKGDLSFDEFNCCFERNSGLWHVTQEIHGKNDLSRQSLGQSENAGFEVFYNNGAAHKLSAQSFKNSKSKRDSSKLRGKARKIQSFLLQDTVSPSYKCESMTG
ncbi:ribosomal RNA processing protein 1 homolog isoform X2 [Euwallacea similis]|uniref:ribosomal RNA processing protein 1 homolog isoform X2 n=1 Tax=Euwallacea similis TaxID=1736056 RepID=UPI00344DD579